MVSALHPAPTRAVRPDEWFHGERVSLRPLTRDDCTERYVSWLNDPEVSRYLETRWSEQTLATVTDFVQHVNASADSYLFGIFAGDGLDGPGRAASGAHVGNIKVGPIHPRYRFADVSYFIGERSAWGRGLASDAIRTAVRVAFDRLGVRRVQALLFEHNVGSARALEKAGMRFEARFANKVLGPEGWQDQIWYGLLNDRDNPSEVP